jgi:hypothetical protein
MNKTYVLFISWLFLYRTGTKDKIVNKTSRFIHKSGCWFGVQLTPRSQRTEIRGQGRSRRRTTSETEIEGQKKDETRGTPGSEAAAA